MSNDGPSSNDAKNQPPSNIPLIQRLLDKPFLLLALGMLVMLAFYTLWGIFEIVTLPDAPLP